MQHNSIKTLTGYIIAVVYFLIVLFIAILTFGGPVFKIAIGVSLVIGIVLWFFYLWLVKFF